MHCRAMQLQSHLVWFGWRGVLWDSVRFLLETEVVRNLDALDLRG